VSNNIKAPLLEFESTNYPNGRRKCTRITFGAAWIGFVSIIVGLISGVSVGKISISAWLLKLIKQ
jgi:hypothetical protein